MEKATKPIFLIRQAEEPKTLELYIYDYVEGDSFDFWSGETIESETSANHIRQELEQAKDVEQINIYINSYGGDVSEGLGIYNQLKRHPAQKTVYVDGFACSIASVIAMVGDKVIMGVNTVMMLHHAAMGVFGNAEELRKAANDVEKIDQASTSSYLEKAGDKLDRPTLNKLLDIGTWLTAEECVQYGLADEIEGKENDNITKAQQRFKQCIKNQIVQMQRKPKVPEQLKQEKNNAEKLMMMFKTKIGKTGGNENDNEE